jgi:hypothetical protein
LNALQAPGKLLLFGGPAGAGKSTLAAAWCRTRPRAAHIEIDAIRDFLVTRFTDPQTVTDSRDREYRFEVNAACTLARAFVAGGCDVAIDDVLEPEAFQRFWRPQLTDFTWKLVIVLPELRRRSPGRRNGGSGSGPISREPSMRAAPSGRQSYGSTPPASRWRKAWNSYSTVCPQIDRKDTTTSEEVRIAPLSLRVMSRVNKRRDARSHRVADGNDPWRQRLDVPNP